MRLRSHLTIVVVAAVLPVLAFSVVLIVLFANQQEAAVERGLRETTRALALAVDGHLAGSRRVLEVIAASPALDGDSPAAFRPIADRALESQPEWTNVVLYAMNGEPVVDLRGGGTSRAQNLHVLRAVAQTARPVVSNMVPGQSTGRQIVQIAVPVIRDGTLRHVLAATIATESFDRLLATQRVPPDWTGAILDRDKVILARSRAPEAFVGRRATPVLATRSSEAAEGTFWDVTQEGRQAYGAFSRSALSGWTVVLGMPASAVKATAQRPFWLILGGWLTLLAVGVVLAVVLARRLSAGISSLAESAQALGRGEPVSPAPRGDIDEINTVRAALGASSQLLGQRSSEREAAERANARLLAEAERAREASEAARQDADFLANATTVLAASLEYEPTLRQLASLAVRRLADWCVIDVVDDHDVIHRVATAHADPAKVELVARLSHFRPGANPNNPVERALASGRAVAANDVTGEAIERVARDAEHLAIMRELGLRAYVMAPLIARGRTLGVVSFVRASGSYGARELALADDLARRAAAAIDNARLYAEAQAASRSKDEFLAMLSHELRTPLTSVVGWTGLLRRGRLEGEAAERALETIERNARLQTQLVEDLLDVSAIVTGKLRLDLAPVDVLGVVETAVDSIRSAAAAKTIHVDTELEPVGLVSGDPARLQQVVANLLSNAVKFTPEGGRIDVALRRIGGVAQLTVRDTGRGIAPDFLPHVFEHFRQADAATTRSYRGLGLGLAIVRHLVELHHGTVTASSAGEGQGATFIVDLPLLDAIASHAASAPQTPLDPVPALDGTTVLLVEDDTDARELLRTILERRGARVVAVPSAGEAREAFARSTPDVIVSDIMMPDEDGYEFMRWVRGREAGGALRTPAIALTAYAATEDRTRVLLAGYDLHLAKPVEPGALVGAVATIAARRPPP